MLSSVGHVLSTFDENPSDNDDDNNENEDEDDDEDEDGDEEADSEDDERTSDDESTQGLNTRNLTTTPCTITQRRHSDTMYSSSLSYGTPVVKRRCTYSSMHDDEQKRSVLVESYRKLRGVKKPKLQVSLLICNLIKRLEKTFTKTSPPRHTQMQQQSQQEHTLLNDHQSYVQYYQQRTAYRSTSSDSIYMTSSSMITNNNGRSSTTSLQYSPPHSSNYDSDKVLLPVNDLRSSSSIYQSPPSDTYWLSQSNFAVPVVMATSEEDDVDVALQGDGDYLDLSDNTLASSFSSCPPPSNGSHSPSVPSSSSSDLISSSISADCCCTTSALPTITKLLVDTNNNHQQQQHHSNHDYFVYQHHFDHQLHLQHDLSANHHLSNTGQPFFYHHHHNGTNNVDIITTA